MVRWKRFTLIGAAVVVLLLIAMVGLALEPAAPATTDLSWEVIASGGQTMSSASYTMLSTVGQPVTGTTTGSSYSVLSGYWYGIEEFVRMVLLPIIVGGP